MSHIHMGLFWHHPLIPVCISYIIAANSSCFMISLIMSNFKKKWYPTNSSPHLSMKINSEYRIIPRLIAAAGNRASIFSLTVNTDSARWSSQCPRTEWWSPITGTLRFVGWYHKKWIAARDLCCPLSPQAASLLGPSRGTNCSELPSQDEQKLKASNLLSFLFLNF